MATKPGRVSGLWVVGPSMLADVCDDDRLRHGEARQATFVAGYGWVQKVALSASFALSGHLTVLVGFDVELSAHQADGVFDRLRYLLTFAPFVALVPAFVCTLRYPIDETLARAQRAALDAGYPRAPFRP